MNPLEHVLQLVSSYSTPLYIVDEVILRQTIRNFVSTFQRYRKNIQIAYSYKTNPLLAICQVMHQEEIWAEVVSGDELQTARKLGVPYSKIIFNGPHKTPSELELAIREGIILNIDNWTELEKVESISRSLKTKISIGLRISTGFLGGSDAKFGFGLQNGEANRALAKVVASDVLSLGGVHFHLGTNISDIHHYLNAIAEVCSILYNLISPQWNLRYIDIGGGFAVGANRPREIVPQDWVVPNIEELAESICSMIDNVCSRETLLFLEPGRALVADSMLFVTKVINIKRPQNRLIGILDGGYNLIPSAFNLAHPVEIISMNRQSEMPSSIEATRVELFGPLCMSEDLIASFQTTKPPRVDDYVIFRSIGAYNYSESFTFSRGRPPVILSRKDGSSTLIRDREAYDALHSLEHLL